MNKVNLIGRLTREVEVKTASNGNQVARFTVAVNRNYKNAEGKYDADFINCIAFKGQAEFISKYFGKGSQIAITGSINTGSYTKDDGTKVYTTDVAVQEVEFVGNNKQTDSREEGMKKESIDELFGKELDSFAPADDDVSLPF